MMVVAIFDIALSPIYYFGKLRRKLKKMFPKKIKEIGEGEGEEFENPKITNREIKLVKMDVAIGMVFAVFVMWSIMVTTAGSLHANEIYEIQTAKQATQALEPLVKTFSYAGEASKENR